MFNLTRGKARRSHHRWPAGLAALLLMLLGGCQASRDGLITSAFETRQALWHRTDSFAHLIIHGTHNPNSNVLHVYIEGDGKPWIASRYIAKDPSPENPLALHLMMQDPQNSLYLGRPCYFTRYQSGVTESDNSCEPAYWTSARYSEAVIESMVAALDAIVKMNAYSHVVLIGYSGGGTIAYLMASRTDSIDRVVTVAANLDHDAWARHHDYSPLHNSLDPVVTPLPRTISQLHLRGARDRNVPGKVLKKFTENDNARWVTFPDYDHVCCWENNWRNILDRFVIDTQTSDMRFTNPNNE